MWKQCDDTRVLQLKWGPTLPDGHLSPSELLGDGVIDDEVRMRLSLDTLEGLKMFDSN